MEGSVSSPLPSPVPLQPVLWPISRLHDSPFQPRKTYDPAKLAELTESIRLHGVCQPVLARMVGDEAQLIAGHRRKRGALGAGLQLLPVIFMDASDEQVRELQHVENLCREDVHPLEEAESFAELLAQHRYTPERVGARIGKSRAYVVRRLSLNSLCAEAAAAFRAGSLSEYGAFTLARLPGAEVQARALRELVSPDGISSDARCRRVAERYMLSLRDAAFDTKSEALVPEAGPCTTCPRRTGANADLFGDFSQENLCTDGGCFAQKTAAAWTLACEKALARGEEILDEETSRHLFAYGGRLIPGAPYVDLAAPCPEVEGNRTWRDVLQKARLQVTLARDDNGRGHRLVLRAEAAAALEALGLKAPTAKGESATGGPSAGAASDPRAAEAAQREAQSRKRATVDVGLEAMVAAAEAGGLPVEVLRYVTRGVLEASWQDVRRSLARRRGFTRRDTASAEQTLLAAVETMTAQQLTGLLVEAVAVRFATPSYAETYGAAFLDGCSLFGLEVPNLEAEALARVAARREAACSKRGRHVKKDEVSPASLPSSADVGAEASDDADDDALSAA
ncbi:ParB/RepB/Spo0J family partition protein [Pyxidicoccus sp. MSG2]|uniref:ParB/RepB/Spo0J family partition protein n=1 Tax=Pyxidicoccus sp. MSG2 TaxID=2996790 RepID=UPI002271F44E|nr:ParB/RepB/Spo0J family partition protein [Pyxidicoccus sp. MSG2]MCY1023938.1 ParB/RepB/Spo0J family partition protein [Pyxidicoccus sp. MSG2]